MLPKSTRAPAPQAGASGGRLLPKSQAELAQLLFIDRAGRLHQQVLRTLGLREGDDIADRLGPGHQRHQAVQAEGDAAVRRRAELQVVEQEAELGARLLLRNAQRLEYFRL